VNGFAPSLLLPVSGITLSALRTFGALRPGRSDAPAEPRMSQPAAESPLASADDDRSIFSFLARVAHYRWPSTDPFRSKCDTV
jgi:hypothetical protein